MIRTQIYISEKLHQTIKLLAQRKKKPFSQLVRQYLADGVLKEKAQTKSKPLSSLSDIGITAGPKDLSQNMDKYLYNK
jgi:hypothetical protein